MTLSQKPLLEWHQTSKSWWKTQSGGPCKRKVCFCIEKLSASEQTSRAWPRKRWRLRRNKWCKRVLYRCIWRTTWSTLKCSCTKTNKRCPSTRMWAPWSCLVATRMIFFSLKELLCWTRCLKSCLCYSKTTGSTWKWKTKRNRST